MAVGRRVVSCRGAKRGRFFSRSCSIRRRLSGSCSIRRRSIPHWSRPVAWHRADLRACCRCRFTPTCADTAIRFCPYDSVRCRGPIGEVIGAAAIYRITVDLKCSIPREHGLPFGWCTATRISRPFGTSRQRCGRLGRRSPGLWGSSLAFPFQVAGIVGLLYAASGTRPYQVGLTTHRFAKNLMLGFLTWVGRGAGGVDVQSSPSRSFTSSGSTWLRRQHRP